MPNATYTEILFSMYPKMSLTNGKRYLIRMPWTWHGDEACIPGRIKTGAGGPRTPDQTLYQKKKKTNQKAV